MTDFKELIKVRRSMRKFLPEHLTQEEVVALFRAALMAPTSKGKHSWQFIAVDDKEVLKKLSILKPHGTSFLEEAALGVVVLADPIVSDVWIEDASLAAVYMQLQAEELGLGSCWVQVRERTTEAGTASDEYVRNVLDIPLQLQVECIIALGRKGMERKPFNEERLLWEKIHLNKYGNK
jgi:nitroreductase